MTGPDASTPDARTPAVPADAPLGTRLREATRVAHERTEARLDVFGPSLTTARYARLLERWYGFELTWQRAAGRALAGFAPPGFLDARRKGPLLTADLYALGRDAVTLPAVPDDALPWHDVAGALGVLYVVEGSTLGGQLVARKIQDRFGLTPAAGAAYFNSYGPDVGTRWRETKRLLDASPDPVRTIAAADAAFTYLGDWLTTPPPDDGP